MRLYIFDEFEKIQCVFVMDSMTVSKIITGHMILGLTKKLLRKNPYATLIRINMNKQFVDGGIAQQLVLNSAMCSASVRVNIMQSKLTSLKLYYRNFIVGSHTTGKHHYPVTIFKKSLCS